MYSLNEMQAMAKRAARGAGYHWGHAEEAGKAVRWLAAHGLPGCHVLAKHFRHHQGDMFAIATPATEGGAWSAVHGDLCPLIAGAFLCDRAGLIATGETFELQAVACPLLLMPYGAAISRLTGLVVELRLDETTTHINADGFAVKDGTEGLMAERADQVICRAAGKTGIRPATTMQGQDLDAGTLTILDALGARTYAPATDASRLAGAGAGLTDND